MMEVNIPPARPRAQFNRIAGGLPFEIQCPPTIIPGATITFCGESPGYNEVQERKGFVGGSGNVLWKMAGAAGISSELVNRTNVAKRRPVSDDFGMFYHDPKTRKKPTEELIFWQELLIKEIEKYRPNVIVAVGDEVLKALTCSSGISKYRGSILESNRISGLKVIPILHPAWIMRMNWQWFYVGIEDLKKAKAESEKRDRVLVEDEPEFIIQPTIEQVRRFIDMICNYPTKEWNVDIETRGDTITCLALSTEASLNKAICIPIQTTSGPYWSEAEEYWIWRQLSKAFRLNSRCMNQNIVYDLDYFLEPYRIDFSGISFDTMAAMKFLYPELDKGLDFSTSLFTNVPYYKDEGKTWKRKTPDHDVWIYNCKDVWVTPKVAKAIRKTLTDQGRLADYERLVNRFIPIALEMQRNRLKVNREWYKQMSDILHDELNSLKSSLDKEAGYEVNVKSGPQVAKLLYGELRLPVKKERRKGAGESRETTKENALKELRASVKSDSQAYRILNGIISQRHIRTRISNYINVSLDDDGHWPYTVLVNNDKTGRWESKQSPKWRGTKVGHIPKVMRLMFEPPEGRVFVQRDLSQGEVRYVAAEARCLFLSRVFASDQSIHKTIGKRLFGVDVVKDSMEYDTAKSIVHAFDYMMGYKRLAVESNLPFDVAERSYNAYAKEVPEIRAWHDRIKDEATRRGKLITPTGRVRQCFAACAMVTNTGQLADEIWRDLVSWKPQSTIPDILNEGMYRTWSELPWVYFHQHGHDSHLDSIPPGRLTEYAELTEAFHRVTVTIDREIRLTIPSDLSWGYLWGAMKPYAPGDKGTREEWAAWCDKERAFEIDGKGKIRERLYALT